MNKKSLTIALFIASLLIAWCSTKQLNNSQTIPNNTENVKQNQNTSSTETSNIKIINLTTNQPDQSVKVEVFDIKQYLWVDEKIEYVTDGFLLTLNDNKNINPYENILVELSLPGKLNEEQLKRLKVYYINDELWPIKYHYNSDTNSIQFSIPKQKLKNWFRFVVVIDRYKGSTFEDIPQDNAPGLEELLTGNNDK